MEVPLDQDDLMVATSCLINEELIALAQGRRLRQRGPDPILDDAEVLTKEIVGAILGLDQETANFEHFRPYHRDLFPAPSVAFTAPPSPDKQPTCGRSGSGSGTFWLLACRTIHTLPSLRLRPTRRAR